MSLKRAREEGPITVVGEKRARLGDWLEVWTDGACSDNQHAANARAGLGVYFGPDDPRNLSEPLPAGERHTNQRAELLAVIRALEVAPAGQAVRLHSDSKYVIEGTRNWMPNWKRNGWRNAKRKPVENQDLWKRWDALQSARPVVFVKVKGHSGDPGNEAADELARAGAERVVLGGETPVAPLARAGKPPVPRYRANPRFNPFEVPSFPLDEQKDTGTRWEEEKTWVLYRRIKAAGNPLTQSELVDNLARYSKEFRDSSYHYGFDRTQCLREALMLAELSLSLEQPLSVLLLKGAIYQC